MIQIPVVDSADTAYNMYRSGALDTAEIIPTSDLPSWRGKKDFIHWGTSVVRYIQTDTTSTPFSNIHCRLAVAHAIDRTTISQKVVPGLYSDLYTVLPPGFLGFYNAKKTLNKAGGTPWYSLSAARKELSKCPGGINVEWPYRVATADARRARDAIGSMLEAAGIHVKFRDQTSQEASHYATTSMSETGAKILRTAWQQDYPDPQDYVSLLLRHGQTYAITGWNNKTFNKLVDQADVEPNRAKRAQLYEQAQKIAISSAIWIPLWNDIGTALVKPYVHGIVGGSAYANLMPSGGDWSKVTIGKH
jgi:ABC-type oligopeptide transport system substrate-binding subunit